jgi:hypothetical protein
MAQKKSKYECPEVDVVELDTEISLSLESPHGDPEPWGYIESNKPSQLA